MRMMSSVVLSTALASREGHRHLIICKSPNDYREA